MGEIILREDLARAAYDAYGEWRNWKTYTGSVMPQWSEVEELIQEAWAFAAHAVEERVRAELA